MPYLPLTEQDQQEMLAEIGISSVADLFQDVPAEYRFPQLKLPKAVSELEILDELYGMALKNSSTGCFGTFLGAGAYNHFVPSAIPYLATRGEFLTAYTPYQPEVSQGMLQCIYEYQSYICMLTGMDICNASGYDGGTTLADAVIMAYYHGKAKRPRVLFAPHVLPEGRQVCLTYCAGLDVTLEDVPPTSDGRTDPAALDKLLGPDVAAVIFQMPQCLGYLEENLAELIAKVHAAGAAAIVWFYPMAAGLLKNPGELGADIVCGEAQCLGNYMGFGGPLLGYLACREGFVRVLPGRLIGRTVCERDGAPGEGFVMTLQAREQHIRREKATSNICSNEALLALRTCIYMGAIGQGGFTHSAALCHANACHAHDVLKALPGASDFYPGRQFFNEFALRFPPGRRDIVYDHALERGILAGIKPDDRCMEGLSEALVFAFTEVHRGEDIAALRDVIQEVL